MRWLDAMHQLAGAHVAAIRERWSSRPTPTVHDLVDDIVSVDGASPWPEPVREAVEAARGLGPREVEWLALLAACELNPRLTRALGYLDDTAAPAPPSPALAAQLWNWPLG